VRAAVIVSQDQRTVFGADAGTYEEVRPGYPGAMFDTLAEATGIGPGGSVLEVGAGTGKASRVMAERGWALTCLEPSAEMRQVLTRWSASQPGITVSGDFLEAYLAGERFRLIIAAQSWHWTDPEVRYQRVHELLAPGGWLALAWNTPRRISREFDAGLDALYQAHAPGLAAREPGAAGPHRGQWSIADLTGSPLFGVVLRWRQDWAESYDAAAYARLLTTQSDHLMLAAPVLAALADEVRRLVEEHGNQVTLSYATDLFLAQRAPTPGTT
jgi:SAM-dependent methyltransferase